MDGSAIKDLVVTMIQLATPFAVLYLTASNNRKIKAEDEKKRADREEAEEKRHALNKTLEDATVALDNARKDIEKLYSAEREIREELAHIAHLNRLNGQYTHQVAMLVTALAEGMRDQKLNGNITSAVDQFRSFEADTLGSFVAGDQKF